MKHIQITSKAMPVKAAVPYNPYEAKKDYIMAPFLNS